MSSSVADELISVVFLAPFDAWSPGDRAMLSPAMAHGLVKGGFARYDDGPNPGRFPMRRPSRLSQDRKHWTRFRKCVLTQRRGSKIPNCFNQRGDS
jgi:hypothetical protein